MIGSYTIIVDDISFIVVKALRTTLRSTGGVLLINILFGCAEKKTHLVFFLIYINIYLYP